MKRLFWMLCSLAVWTACSPTPEPLIHTKHVTDAQRRGLNRPNAQRITFYNMHQQPITPDQFNQLLAEGSYFSEQRMNQNGAEEVHLVSIADYSSRLENQTLPYFNITDLQGNQHNKATLRGKVTVISFWSTESQWCVGEMTRLNKLAQLYANDQTVQWIAPSLEPSLQVSHFLQDFSWSYSFVADQQTLADQLGILTVPTHLVIDQNGQVVKAVVRDSASPAALQMVVDRLL